MHTCKKVSWVSQAHRSLSSSCVWSGWKRSVVRDKNTSSHRWLQRQRKDPLVNRAAVEQLRCRSAFKLIELDDKYHFIKRRSIVIDCGAKPGSWTQVATKRIGTAALSRDELLTWRYGMVVSVDIGAVQELPGAVVMENSDVLDSQTHNKIKEFLGGRNADVVMSDMAPNASGMHDLDHQRIMELCSSASDLAGEVLGEGGVFLCKILQGALTSSFLEELRLNYQQVKECRLKATRKESSEFYILAKGYTFNST